MQIGIMTPTGRARKIPAIWRYPDSFQYEHFLNTLRDKYSPIINIFEDDEAKYTQYENTICGAGVTTVDVDNDGWVFPCLFGAGRKDPIGHICNGLKIFTECPNQHIQNAPRISNKSATCPEYCPALCARNELL